MKRRVFCGLLLAASLLTFSSCSTTTEFVIVNDSGSAVEVRYAFKPSLDLARCCPQQPAKKALDKLDDDEAPWRKLGAGEFAYDPATGTLTVTLGPGEVLGVVSYSNWGGHGGESEDQFFPLASVRIAGASGAVSYEGLQAQYQFQRGDDRLYRLTYYGWGDKRDGRGK
jgi:hypothetical protein